MRYLFTIIFQTVQFFNAVLVISSVISFFIGCCKFIVVSVNDIKEHFYDLNEDVKNQCGNLTHQTRIEVDEKLCQILQFHGEVMQLS